MVPARIGRPEAEIDPDQVRELAGLGCTQEEAARVLKCSARTIRDRFGAEWDEGRAVGKASLRRMQFAAARKGNAQVLVWLGKVVLRQHETPPDEGDGAAVSAAPDPETLRQAIDDLAELGLIRRDEQAGEPNQDPVLSVPADPASDGVPAH